MGAGDDDGVMLGVTVGVTVGMMTGFVIGTEIGVCVGVGVALGVGLGVELVEAMLPHEALPLVCCPKYPVDGNPTLV